MTARDLEGLEERLLAALPKDGSPKTNAALRHEINASADDYWLVRDSLYERGQVMKLRGRGGRTARVVKEDASRGLLVSWSIGWVSGTLFAIAVLLMALAAWLFISASNDDGLWNAAGLAFGAATVAAIGVSVMIFRLQAETQRDDRQAQAVVLQRIEQSSRRSEWSSEATRVFVAQMQPAKDASAKIEPLPQGPTNDSDAEDELESHEASGAPSEGVIPLREGAYYRPPSVPLKVLSDLVKWWEVQGEQGRWTIANLAGAYRRFNDKGDHRGVPWVLKFVDSSGSARVYSVTYSGRKRLGQDKATATVSVYTADVGWRPLEPPTS